MDVEWIIPYRQAFPWSARAAHALAALVGGALYARAAVSQRRLPHQRPGGASASAALALDLVLLLPLLAVNAVLPFCFDSNGDELLSRLAVTFAATWLGSFKAVGAALGRGPLAQAPWTPAQYTLLYAAPVYPSAGCTGGAASAPKASSGGAAPSSASPSPSPSPGAARQRLQSAQQGQQGGQQQGQQQGQKQEQRPHRPPRLQGRLADDAGSLSELLLALAGNATALAACAAALVRHDIPPWPRMYVYALALYAFVSVLMGVPAALIRGLLGVTLVPPFDRPWLSHSAADYWGRRWNNTTSLHLRSLVYDVVAEGCWVRPGGHAMAALGGGGATLAGGGGGVGGAAPGRGGGGGGGAARLGSAGGLLASFLSCNNLAEMAAAGSRPGSPDDRSARRRPQSPALLRRRGDASSPTRDGGSPAAADVAAAAAAAAPPSTPAGNTRSRARAAATATATVSIASYDLEKRHPPHGLSSAFQNGGGGVGGFGGGASGGGVVSASPSPVRDNGDANGGGGYHGALNGAGGLLSARDAPPPLVALAPAPAPSQTRRDLGVLASFFVSGVFHEIILLFVVPDPSLGWWFAFFTVQAPLMVCERAALRWLRARGVPLPTALRRAVTTVLLLGVARLLFFPPIENRSDLALRVAGAVTAQFAALARGVSGSAAAAMAALA